ncbi:DoxX family protein [Streptomyces sp. NPDC002588]|uniref:DoxX family protein n=1 Tax=Streptomyces sp. NPDC002588 TaxID=3154419 RepID=UPI0033202095
MNVVAALASALVILEFSLQALGMLTHMEAQLVQFDAVTGRRPSRSLTLLLGLLDVVGVAGVIAGFWESVWAVLAGVYFVVFTGIMLGIQLRRGNRGMLLNTGILFFGSAVLLVISRALS